MSHRSPLEPFPADGSHVLGYAQPSPLAPAPTPYLPMHTSSPGVTHSLAASHNPDTHHFPPPPTPLRHKESGLSLAGSSEPSSGRPRRLAWPAPSWEGAWKYSWMAGPPLGYFFSIVFLAVAIFQQTLPYGSAVEAVFGGRIDFMILNACVTASNSTIRTCTPQSFHANFVPALIRASPSMPGFAVLQLPFKSLQTPTIFLAALVCLCLSLLIFAPVWSVYHFPAVPLPARLLRLVRFYPSYFYQLAALLSGAAFTVSLSIGVGYELYMFTFAQGFENYVALGLYEGMGTVKWTFELGNAFSYVWAAVAFQALVTISTVCSLHNGFDETIEYQDLKGIDPYRF